MKEITEDEFMEYHPIVNHFDENAGFEGCLFETFGPELEYVAKQDPKHVWTFISGDGGDEVTTGVHIVNRVGYLITEVPWEEELYCSLEGGEQDEEE